MRLAAGLSMSEIKNQMVGYGRIGDVIVMQTLSLQSQIYAKGMCAGMVLRKLFMSEMLQE